MDYTQSRGVKTRYHNMLSRFRGGVLQPVCAVPFLQGEGGTVTQTADLELDPVAGRLMSEVLGQVVSVWVPMLAIDIQIARDPETDGNKEIFRTRLARGDDIFRIESVSEISTHCGIIPMPINGANKVSSMVRHGHNAAVNYLRRMKYVDAKQVEPANRKATPALFSSTALQRLNGVLDPEDRINGAVNLQLGTVKIPVKSLDTSNFGDNKATPSLADGEVPPLEDGFYNFGENIFGDLDGISAGSVSLTDFYRAERIDEMTRYFRKIVDQNPQFGEEIVSRMVHGLEVESHRQPMVVYEKEGSIQQFMRHATDGANLGKEQTEFSDVLSWTVPIPKSEFGGMLFTFVSVKPDERLGPMPDPTLTRGYQAYNYAADDLVEDPVPVMARQLSMDVDPDDEATVMMYVGNHGLERSYENYGLSLNLNANDVANKSAIWQVDLPLSVTPETILYPEDLDHYPFQDQEADVVTCRFNSVARINSPVIFGPDPVEELKILDTQNLFDDVVDGEAQ